VAAPVTTCLSIGRNSTKSVNPSLIKFQIAANASPYVTANGGLAIDLTAILNNPGGGGADWTQPNINPSDVIDMLFTSVTATNLYTCANFSFNTANVTTTTPTYPFESPGSGQTVRPATIIATAPAFIRLYTANVEVANGNITDTITGYLVIEKGGWGN
jgi:hypothetical protein